MGASILPMGARLQRPPESAGVLVWLDAMAAGTCSQDEFLQQVQKLTAKDADVPFEVLSLLDQHMRRERITREVYTSLKTRLQQRSFGFGTDTMPVLRPEAASATPATASTIHTSTTGTSTGTSPVLTQVEDGGRPLGVGEVLRGRYRVLHILSRNSAGTLIEAADDRRVDVPGVGQRIAIQVMHEGSQNEPQLLQRMCALQSLSHPGIVRVLDVDADRGTLFLTMEWLTGVSLQKLLEQSGGGRLAVPAVQTIIRTLASALAYAHSRDVFHGEVSAANVFITDSGEVRLRGFEMRGRGLAANPKADRLAFAWLAHGLLAGIGTPLHSRPPGLTGDQWLMLRDALKGKEGNRRGNVLTVFAGDGSTVGRVSLLQAFAPPPKNRMGASSWVAMAIVATILGVGGYLVATHGTTLVPSTGVEPLAAAPVSDQLPGTIVEPTPVAQSEVAPAATAVAASAPAVTPVTAPAPVYSRSRIDLPEESIGVDGAEPMARIWVRRRGGLSGEVSFLWWTESGSAQVDRDYAQISPRREYIGNGANGVALLVPLVSDVARDQPRTFYVKIDDAGEGALLGDRTLMQVVIEPAGFVQP